MSNVYKIIENESDFDEEEPLSIPDNERRLVTMPYDYSIDVLHNQFKDGRLIVEEEGFQRKYVWDDTKASALIESLILNVPIPVCYFSEDENGLYTVIDGHQRIKSIYRFIDNQFKLRGLKVFTELNKKKFFELSSTIQRNLLNRTIRCIVLLQESHPELKFDIFERLNTGAVQLNAQELRNCMYRGKLNDLTKTMVKTKYWLNALNTTRPHIRMLDREMIIRFFALVDGWKIYTKPMKSFLNKYMRKAKSFDDNKIEELNSLFHKTIEDVYYVFGKHSFRKYSDNKWESTVNKALFDAVMVEFAQKESNSIRKNKSAILRAYKEIQDDEDFYEYITQSTSDVKHLKGRIKLWKSKLSSILGA